MYRNNRQRKKKSELKKKARGEKGRATINIPDKKKITRFGYFGRVPKKKIKKKKNRRKKKRNDKKKQDHVKIA